MANELVLLEDNLNQLAPRYEQALAGRMPAQRLIRTVLVSAEKTPRILECTRQSVFNAAMTAAVLALEVDGVTGQGFIIPYNIKGTLTAQFQLGYKGMNTLGARSGYSISAGTVREGDLEWDYREGSGGFVRHKRALGNKGRVIAFWSVAESRTLTPLISILSIDDALAIKARSPGAKKPDSPWNDPVIGFEAMGQKSARRRHNRSMPLNAATIDFHRAAAVDEAFDERGKPSWIREDGAVMVENTPSPLAAREPESTPTLENLSGPKPDAEMARLMEEGLDAAEGGSEVVAAWWKRLTARQQHPLEGWKEQTLKPLAERADKDEPI